MGIERTPETYTTSDGSKFTVRTDAERHEKVWAAVTAFNEATSALEAALLETQRTGDGRPFKLSWYETYYWVRDAFSGPVLSEITLTRRDFSMGDNGDVIITKLDKDKSVRIQIADLYARKDAAMAAYLILRRKRHADQAEDLAELERRVANGGV